MTKHPRPDALPDVFRGADAVAAGLITKAQLRGPHMVRVLRGVYRPAWVPLTHLLVCRAAALVVPEETRLTGRSLATLRGVELAGPDDPVEVVLPHPLELRYDGIDERRASTGPLGDGTWEGLRLAHAYRMAFDLAARRDLPTATAYLDAAVKARLFHPDRFGLWLRTRHEDDVRDVRRACALIDSRTGSLQESRLRVVLTEAGIPVVPQHQVFLDGRPVARVDLAVPELKVAIEYDGAWHVLRTQLERDRQRLNDLQAAGWAVVHVTADMLRDPEALVAAVRAALARAAARP